MNNAYVRRLMENNEPTDKDLESIKKEKPAKIPKKKYFGGATKPEDVDTKAAIESHRSGIKAAGQAAVKKAQDKRDAEDKAAQQAEAYRALGHRLDEFLAMEARSPRSVRQQATQDQAKKRREEAKSEKPKPTLGSSQPGLAAAAEGLAGLSIRKPKPVKDWTEYHRMGKLFMEWEAGPTAKRIAAKSPGGEGSRMSDQGDKAVSKDPLVAAETKKTVKNVEKKLGGAKTNLKTADAVQGSMNRRRGESKARGEGIPSVDRGSKFGKALSKAEGEEDRKKLAGPSG
tara:strand:+ start:2448 stop:3305 length:858 start_codon:yes stop_codon:yes gene_type:complete